MIAFKNHILYNENALPVLLDIKIPSNDFNEIAIFCHGFKGYKDWGPWQKIADFFVEHNIGFVLFNFSHNGGTIDIPIDFPDLNAFGLNNFSKELIDIQSVINFVQKEYPLKNIHLIGHSRGGAMAILSAIKNTQVKSVITLAAVTDLSYFFNKVDIVNWEKEGVVYIPNQRTNQQMPLYFQFYQDYIIHADLFDIQKNIRNSTFPLLMFHGGKDISVSIDHQHQLNYKHAKKVVVKDMNHTFNMSHPYLEDCFSDDFQCVLDKMISFIISEK